MPKKRTTKPKLPAAVTQLIALQKAAINSSLGPIDQRFWEPRIESLLQKLLAANQDDVIEAALDELSTSDVDAADDLFDHLQTASQSVTIELDGQPWQVVLMTAAFAIWTRYQLPQTSVPEATLQEMLAGLQKIVLAPGVRVHAMPKLLGVDEMPRSFSENFQWLMRLGQRTLGKRSAVPTTITVEPNPALLVDTRHLVFAIAAPVGEPLFAWQHDLSRSIEQCALTWDSFVGPITMPLLPGCQFHALLPQPYHGSIEFSEKHMRVVAIQSACQWLNGALNLKPGELQATIAAVGEQGVDEYRVGYQKAHQPDVVYGTIWPIFEDFDDPDSDSMVSTVDEIAATLKESGVTEIKQIPGILRPEGCEDCGAPFFPNRDGELVHLELPEEAFDAPQHFH